LGQIPDYIYDGGYFPTNDGYLYGVSIPLDTEEIPPGTTWVSESEFEAVLTVCNKVLGENETPINKAIFESNKYMFRYNETTLDTQISAINQALLELALGSVTP
jgi:L-alanine-DL-glutamate epimerase-like enolase superfamily enzyme